MSVMSFVSVRRNGSVTSVRSFLSVTSTDYLYISISNLWSQELQVL